MAATDTGFRGGGGGGGGGGGTDGGCGWGWGGVSFWPDMKSGAGVLSVYGPIQRVGGGGGGV